MSIWRQISHQKICHFGDILFIKKKCHFGDILVLQKMSFWKVCSQWCRIYFARQVNIEMRFRAESKNKTKSWTFFSFTDLLWLFLCKTILRKLYEKWSNCWSQFFSFQLRFLWDGMEKNSFSGLINICIVFLYFQ